MVDPRLYIYLTWTVNHHNRVVVVLRNRLNEIVCVGPEREVLTILILGRVGIRKHQRSIARVRPCRCTLQIPIVQVQVNIGSCRADVLLNRSSRTDDVTEGTPNRTHRR